MDPWMLWIDSFLGLIHCLMLAWEVMGGGGGGAKNSPGNWILLILRKQGGEEQGRVK